MSESRYRKTTFLLSAHTLDQCPQDSGFEVAFAGRSNVGKSSVINAVTGNHKLARTSKIPGRTQQLNFFKVEDGVRLVDLPGYGYARVPEKLKQHWGMVLQSYFEMRNSLRGLFLIMDIRHPFKPFDIEMLEWCAKAGLPAHILLNKADKLSRAAARRALEMAGQRSSGRPVSTQLFSIVNKTGIEEARQQLDSWLYPDNTK